MKYVNFTLKEMTPQQMKMNPIKPIIKVKTNDELDTQEWESNIYEQESSILNKEEEEYSTHQIFQNKILNQTLMLMILNIQKIHIYLKQRKTTQQYMIKLI